MHSSDVALAASAEMLVVTLAQAVVTGRGAGPRSRTGSLHRALSNPLRRR